MEQDNCVTTSTPPCVPSNTFNVEPGQIWNDTDARRPRQISVTGINELTGVALVHNVANGRKSKVRLDRFSPAHHMRKADQQVQ